jgi:hypothetical protein
MPAASVRGASGTHGGQLTIELSQGAGQLLLASVVLRLDELPAQFRVRQSQRLRPAEPLGVLFRLAHGAARALFFALVHPFLNTILSVNQSFTSVCHLHLPLV